MQWNVAVHKETFPYMYRLPLYYFPMIAKILQPTEKWCSNVTMDMWKISFFWRLHPSSQKTRIYWTIITFACLDAIYREFLCIWVTLVWPILHIPESYEGMEECISRRSRNQSLRGSLKIPIIQRPVRDFSVKCVHFHSTRRKSFHASFVCLFTFWNPGVVFLISSSKSSDFH